MPDPTPSPVDDLAFGADYIARANALDKARESGESPIEIATPSQPVSPVDPQAPVAEAESVKVEAEADATDRNPDGTFKPKAKKTDAKAEDVPRIRELTAKLRQAERERDELKAPRPAPAPVQLDDDKEPEIDQFLDQPDPYAALAKASGKWAARHELKQVRQQEIQQQASRTIQSRVEAFIADHPDYLEKMAAVEDIRFPPMVLDAIAESEVGPAVAYHLANDPTEARRVAMLSPLQGTKAIGQLEARLTPAPSGSGAETPPSISKAKPLIKPVSAAPNAPSGSSPDDLDFGPDYIRRKNADDRKREVALRGY